GGVHWSVSAMELLLSFLFVLLIFYKSNDCLYLEMDL
ncbi:hypothetical protein HKBW3S06_00924, partial [Candidatus Hakubella thermalkaliphila]